MVAAQVPETPAEPASSLETIYVKLQWTAPSANFAAIVAYQIWIKDSAGLYIEELVHCDGSQQIVIDALDCRIPMTALWAAPFNLAQGALVSAKVRARNARGWSATSPANALGAAVATVPHQMVAPTRGATTTDTTIQVDWLATSTPEDGGSPVLGYALYSDDATGEASWVELAGETALYAATTFT